MKIIFAIACVLFGVNQMAEALQVSCTFTITPDTQQYSCEASIIITGDIKNIDRLHGLHLLGRGNGDTKGLEIKHQRGFKKFPRGFGRFFKKCKKIVVEDTEIEEISGDDFEGLDEIEDLDLSDNQIIEIPDDTFKFLTWLKNLKLSGNPIISFGDKVFDFLLNLETFDVSKKKCDGSGSGSGEKDLAKSIMKLVLKNQACNADAGGDTTGAATTDAASEPPVQK